MLVQLIDTADNVNNAVSIIVCWIYDSNYKRALTFIKEYLDIICSSYRDQEGIYAEFKDVHYAVRYANPKAKPEKTEQVNTSLDCVFSKEIINICVFQH